MTGSGLGGQISLTLSTRLSPHWRLYFSFFSYRPFTGLLEDRPAFCFVLRSPVGYFFRLGVVVTFLFVLVNTVAYKYIVQNSFGKIR